MQESILFRRDEIIWVVLNCRGVGGGDGVPVVLGGADAAEVLETGVFDGIVEDPGERVGEHRVDTSTSELTPEDLICALHPVGEADVGAVHQVADGCE